MRYQGKLVEWNDAKGFGFVLPNAGGRKIFVHQNEFTSQTRRRPTVGDLLTFEVGLDQNRRSCAVKVAPVMDPQQRQRAQARQDEKGAREFGLRASLWLAIVWTVVVVAYAVWARISWPPLAVWTGINLVTYFVYAADKAAAENGARRTPELNLHVLAFVGGWPAAALAQRVLRHKTSKAEFRLVFWIMVFMNCGATIWLATKPDLLDLLR